MMQTWKKAVHDLALKVEDWISKDSGIVSEEKNMDPSPDEPLLEILVNGENIVRLEPAAFAANKVPTKVYLYAYPSLRRVVLVGPDEHDSWDIQSSDGVSMNYLWTGESIRQLLFILAEKHVPGSV